MDENIVYERINVLLEQTDYPLEITDMRSLEEFLNDDSNSKYEVYEEIEGLYNDLIEYSEV